MSTFRPLPAYWTGENWIVHSSFSLTSSQLKRIALWLLKVQTQRRVSLKPGFERDELDKAILALKQNKIVCGLEPDYKDMSGSQYKPFSSTEGTGKIIILGAK